MAAQAAREQKQEEAKANREMKAAMRKVVPDAKKADGTGKGKKRTQNEATATENNMTLGQFFAKQPQEQQPPPQSQPQAQPAHDDEDADDDCIMGGVLIV